MRYLYCPKCGTKLIGKAAGDDGDVPFCTSCNRYWFDRFSCCVIVLVANEYDELAMIRQYRLSERYWTYVAGFITPGETAEEAARREVKEELGLELDRLEYGGTYWFADHEQLMHGFIGFTRKKILYCLLRSTKQSGFLHPKLSAKCFLHASGTHCSLFSINMRKSVPKKADSS